MTPYRWLMLLVTVVALVLLGGKVVDVIRAKKLGDRLRFGYTSVTILYAVGVGLKFSLVGPAWIRWHLSDIGFPLFVAAILWSFGRKRFQPLPDRMWADATLIRMAWIRSACIVLGLVLSVAYEFYEGFVRTIVLASSNIKLAGFDPIDVWCYVGGTAIGLVLVLLPLWRFKRRPTDARAIDLMAMTVLTG